MPDYYNGKGGMQPFDVIDAFGLDFYEGNIIKYVCRWRKKNGVEDLYKARTYINQVIKRAEAEKAAEDGPAECPACGSDDGPGMVPGGTGMPVTCVDEWHEGAGPA